jgi:hypothetical protein
MCDRREGGTRELRRLKNSMLSACAPFSLLVQNDTILEMYRKARAELRRPWIVDDFEAVKLKLNEMQPNGSGYKKVGPRSTSLRDSIQKSTWSPSVRVLQSGLEMLAALSPPPSPAPSS